MMLRRRMVVTSLVIALPAAAVITAGVEWVRSNDMRVSVERVVRSQVNEQVRERCESDPGWFLTGPLVGRPKNGIFLDPNPDALSPRPLASTQPFELYAYDEELAGSSIATPRLPQEFRAPLRTEGVVAAPFSTAGGTGRQFGIATEWKGSPCAYFLGRLAPPPGQLMQRAGIFAGVLAFCFGVALLTAYGAIARVRRLAQDTREAVDAGYTAIASDKLKDELSSLTFVYNDMATELHQRRKEIEDQETALRRFVQTTADEVAGPLSKLEAELGAIGEEQTAVDRERLRKAQVQSHNLASKIDNLAAAARLRMAGTPSAERIDLRNLVQRVVARHQAMARTAGISLRTDLGAESITVRADEPLFERALSNVIDNAVRYSRLNDTVTVKLSREGQRFLLKVSDTGPGVSDEHFKTLTAIRRFRGDEGRNRRPGAPGLGLAIAREACERIGITFEVKRPPAGGLDVEFSGTREA